MEQHILTMGNYRLACQLPQQAVRQLVYFHSPVDDLTPPGDLLEQAGAAFLCITGEDWNADLTPWPAERVFAKGGDFGGRADRYLRVLTEELLPFAEHSLHVEGLPRTLAGVSLSGLFAVYAAHRTDAFHRICSVSGSLWYDGFLDFMVQNPVSPAVRRVYLSVGSREKNAKNPRMRRGEDCTLRAAGRLRQQDVDTRMEINPGGHYADGAERLRKGLTYILA